VPTRLTGITDTLQHRAQRDGSRVGEEGTPILPMGGRLRHPTEVGAGGKEGDGEHNDLS